MTRKTRIATGAPVFALALLLGAGEASAQSSTIALRGIVRDFRADHPDFAPGLARGHCAGSAGLELGADGKPAFTGNGYEVASEWRDKFGRPIAPNMFFKGTVAVAVVSEPILENPSYVDAFDYSSGAYTPSRAGEASFMAGSPMPQIDEPALEAPHQPSFIRDKNESSVLSGDVHTDVFRLYNQHRLWIEGDVTVIVEQRFEMNNLARIELADGATLRLYLKGESRIQQQTAINGNTRDPRRVEIYNLGSSPVTLENYTDVYASLVSPYAPLTLNNNTDFFGPVIAQSVHLRNSSALHVDGNPNVCSMGVQDVRGSAGASGGGIDSAATFAHWYNDTPGVNASRLNTIVLRDNGSGLYEFADGDFFPIDGKLYGNQGFDHNYRFTYEIPATFTYEACTGQSVWFEGSDDCWIYIDDQLVVDLGGVAPATGQFAELDRLDLEDGKEYTFRLFYAHRTAETPRFTFRTNVPLIPEPVNAGIARPDMYD
jgi:fibro-slime domain-containing protein